MSIWQEIFSFRDKVTEPIGLQDLYGLGSNWKKMRFWTEAHGVRGVCGTKDRKNELVISYKI